MAKQKFDFESLTTNPEKGDGIITVMRAEDGRFAVVATVYPTKVRSLRMLAAVLKSCGFDGRHRHNIQSQHDGKIHISFVLDEKELEAELKLFVEAIRQSGVMCYPIVVDYTCLSLSYIR